MDFSTASHRQLFTDATPLWQSHLAIALIGRREALQYSVARHREPTLPGRQRPGGGGPISAQLPEQAAIAGVQNINGRPVAADENEIAPGVGRPPAQRARAAADGTVGLKGPLQAAVARVEAAHAAVVAADDQAAAPRVLLEERF